MSTSPRVGTNVNVKSPSGVWGLKLTSALQPEAVQDDLQNMNNNAMVFLPDPFFLSHTQKKSSLAMRDYIWSGLDIDRCIYEQMYFTISLTISHRVMLYT